MKWWMACNIKRLKTQCSSECACLCCGSAYMQAHVLTYSVHTQSLGPLISGFIFDINLLWGGVRKPVAMSLRVVGGHNRSELFKKVFLIAACAILDNIPYWYVHWSPHYGHRWKRTFQRSLMSAVPVKVILMGFNLLLGARGNILMRKSHYTTLVIL